MHVIVDFTLVPVGTGISLSPYVAEVERILEKSGLNHELHANATNLEGEWDEVMAVVKKCYMRMRKDCNRVSCSIKIDYRKGPKGRLSSKVSSVESQLKRKLKV